MGDRLSLADIAVCCAVAPYEASISGVSLKRWYMTCSADPAFGAAGSGGGGGAGAVEEVDASDKH